MRRIIGILGIALVCQTALGKMYTSEPIRVEAPKGTFNIYLHRDGNTFYISHGKDGTLRTSIAVLPGESEVLPEKTSAWFDQNATLVYVTQDGKLSAIYPVYSKCGFTKELFDTNKQDRYVGIYPNPEYRIQYARFYSVGPYAQHCFVFTDGKPYEVKAAEPTTQIVTQPNEAG